MGSGLGQTSLRVNEVEIRTAALPAAFDGFRIVQFSDLHIGTLVRPEREMNRLVDTINALRPDLVVFSGDLVNVRSTELTSDVLAILGSFAPRTVSSRPWAITTWDFISKIPSPCRVLKTTGR